MNRLKAVVFDADGTLFDTFELIVSAYRHVAETHNLRVPTSDEIHAQLGRSLPDIFKHFYPDGDINTLLHTNNEYVAANVMKSEAFKGIEEMLEYLHGRGLALAVLTSGSVKVFDVLKHHGLNNYFTSVVHHERIQNPKPDPEGFFLACAECGVESGSAIMVGDTTMDIETGKNAGALATIALTHGFGSVQDLKSVNPDYMVGSLMEVKDVITKLLMNA